MPIRHTSNSERFSDTARKQQSAQPASYLTTRQTQADGMARLQQAIADPGAASPSDILALQCTVGNRAVQRLLASHTVQAKLSVSPAHDRYEEEADRVAMEVTRRVEPTPPAQREVRPEEEEQEVQTKRVGPGDGFEVGGELEGRLRARQGGGHPLPEEARSAMESRFGADFDKVRVHTDGEAARLSRSLSAQAFTRGADIYFGESKYDPGSAGGQQLLAHELTHVIQQTGRIQPRVQRWALSTPLKGQAGHETLTLEALKKAYPQVFEQAQNYKDAEGAWEYIRGALWNDDPAASLFWTRKTRGLGLSFVAKFLKGEHLSSSLGPEGSLTGRSHVGDLQFLHGMADPTETTIRTKQKVMMWAEFTYKVATGVITGDTTLANTGVEGLAALFPKQKEWTVNKLFDVSNTKSSVQKRAAGSLLHMMQDTFCESHSQRAKDQRDQNTKGKIVSFRAYGAQKSSKHAKEDELVRQGWAKNRQLKKAGRKPQAMAQILGATPGAQQAVNIGATILQFVGDKRPWATAFQVGERNYSRGVKGYLDEDVFGLAEGVEAHTAAPGKQFRKSTKKIVKDFRGKTSRGWLRGRDASLRSIDRLLAAYEGLDDPSLTGPEVRNTKIGILNQLDEAIGRWLEGRHSRTTPQKGQRWWHKLGRGLKTAAKGVTSPLYFPGKAAFYQDPDTHREVQVLRSIILEMKRDLEAEAREAEEVVEEVGVQEEEQEEQRPEEEEETQEV